MNPQKQAAKLLIASVLPDYCEHVQAIIAGLKRLCDETITSRVEWQTDDPEIVSCQYCAAPLIESFVEIYSAKTLIAMLDPYFLAHNIVRVIIEPVRVELVPADCLD